MKNFWQRIRVFFLWHYRVFIRVGIGIVCCLFILASAWQCWVIPHINEYQGWVTAKLETALGRQVQIGKLQAGWRGFKPYLRFSDFIMYNQATVPAFHLQRLEARLSWWHLLVGKVNFSHIRLVNPNITIQRDKHAMWWVGGIPLQATTAGDNQWLNWLWQQSDIHIEQGLLHWEDDTAQTKSVTLRQVNMHLSRLLSRHSIQINFLPSQSVSASPFTIEAIIYGENIDAFSQWHGEISLADVQGDFAQLWPYLPSAIRPFELIQAAGRISALRLVFDTLTTWQLSFQTQLTNIEALFDKKLAPLKIAQFQGRVKLDYGPTHEKISLENFSIQPPSIHSEKPANFFYEKNKGGYRVKAQHIFLQSMWTVLPSLPQLAYVTRHATHLTGLIKHVDLQWPKQPRAFEQVKGVVDVENVAIRTPTLDIRHVNLQLHLQGMTGKAHLSGKSLYIDYPEQFVVPLSLKSAQLTTRWQKVGKGWEMNIRHLAASNAEMALQLKGRYYYSQNNEDSMILQGKVIRANANRIYAYLPRVLGDDVLLWLKNALYAGEAKDTTIQVVGKLKHFPFANGEPGKFDIAGRINNVGMAYAENWPAISNITGRLHFTKRGMTISADNAQTSQVKLSHIVARMPDMKYDEKILINGQAVGKTACFLQFLKHSPLQELLSTGGEHLQIQGEGALALNLAIPLAMPQQTQVQGAFRFQENRLDFGKNIPTLRSVQGKLTFTEKGLVLKNMQANTLGGDINLQGQTDAEGLTLDIVGRANMAQVAKYYMPDLPPVLKGNTSYRAQLKLAAKHYTFDLSSALKGVTLALPAPLTKAANDSSPLTLHIHDRAGEPQLTFNYGNQVAGDIAWRGKNMSTIEGEITLHPATDNSPKKRNGLWLTGQIEQINGHDWQPFFTSNPVAENRYLQGIDMHIAQLTGYGYQLKEIDLLAQRQTNGWTGEIVADNLAGHFSLQTADKWRIQLNLSKLYWPWQPFPTRTIKNTEKFDEHMLQGKNFPILQANITDLRYQGQKLGQFYAHVTPAPQAWQLNRLRLINEDGELGMKGRWDYRPHAPMTDVEIQIDSQHAERFLHRFGQTQVMKGGRAIINTHLQWQDSPFAIDYASMAGEVQVRAQKGQFAQVDPGAGRLLGMLSLQALPRRMSLDFSDIFSAGLVFDIVEGRSVIKKGVAYLDHLVINGPAAQILFHGKLDIVHQQQNLTVKIIPVVGDGVSIAAGVLVNPLIGVGAFIVQRLLKDPVGQLAAYQYTITGTWQDPIITKLNGSTKQQNDDKGGE